MPGNRSRDRTVYIQSALYPDDVPGGLILSPSVTQQNFLFMLEILIVASEPYSVPLRCTGEFLTASDEPLKPGHYDIRSTSPGGIISVSDEPCIRGVELRSFGSKVRERDRKRVITGTINIRAHSGCWVGFEAAHIFPLSHEQLFADSAGYDSGINSCQNGLLMLSFRGDGRILDSICRAPDDEHSVRDELLRWHFRQAVLTNMRGAGEQDFEIDFPPGTDMVGEILNGPQPGKRMEAELFLRLDRFSWQKGFSD
ncbi:hypothetical protein V1527DRAFT_501655 [Lipomyces starkeyi]